MPAYSSRAYLVGSPALRDRLIADLAAAGVAAVPGPGVAEDAWAEADYRPRLVFVRGEPIPYSIATREVRRCQYHRDRNEMVTARGPTMSGSPRLCTECRAALTTGRRH